MSNFELVDPQGWEYDLQSVYSAYMGHFQLHNVPWYDRSWGPLFETFEEFLGFSWPVITVTDAWTGRPHIVTRMTSIGAFLKMIKTRFGETLPTVDNMLKVHPFETTQRHLRKVHDWSTYKKIHSSLPAVVLAAFKQRVKSGEPKAICELWAKRDKTFLSIDFEWSERNTTSCLEWGYAAMRCGHLEAMGAWPPVAGTNYRKGHYIISEYVDKVHNKHCPTYPWHYAFGESQVIGKSRLPQVIQAVISSLVSPDSETSSNNLVLVGHGVNADLQRLEEMKIKLPHNVLIVDTAVFERMLFNSGQRGIMQDPKAGKSRLPGSTLGLGGLLHSLGIDVQCALHNSGNDAFLTLLALQKLLDPEHTAIPDTRGKNKLRIVPQTLGAVPIVPSMFMSASPRMSRMSTVIPAYGGVVSPAMDFSQSQSLRPDLLRPQATGNGSPDELGQIRRSSRSPQTSSVDRRAKRMSALPPPLPSPASSGSHKKNNGTKVDVLRMGMGSMYLK